MLFINSSSGKKLDVPVCEILPVATVTALGMVFACMNDLTSGILVSIKPFMIASGETDQEHML